MQAQKDFSLSDNRIERLKNAVTSSAPGICTERALLWTAYSKDRKNSKKPAAIQVAEATRHVLFNKTVKIHQDELIVGNYTSKRVGGIIYPELHGLPILLDILEFPVRKVNPLAVSRREQFLLARIIPFWMNRFLVAKAFPNPMERLRYSWEQLRAREYFIHEAGGIAHLAPNHERLISMGTDAIAAEIESFRERNTNPSKDTFYMAARMAVDGLALFGERYAAHAETLAEMEKDPERKSELLEIARVCRRVPRHGAGTFREALQSMFFLHVTIFQESMGETICLGRIDQLLYPYYVQDLEHGRISPSKAQELLAAFCIKLCETIPVYSQTVTNLNGGMPSWQVVTMGGTDRQGIDATNELSFMLLDIAEKLRMRQPNFHARVHRNTPKKFIRSVYSALSGGSNSPALFNDEVIVPTMTSVGYERKDALDYVAIGCVEPTAPGKTLGSTDAAILNVPLAVELALNQGRRFGERLRIGAATPLAESMEDFAKAFVAQLEHLVGRTIRNLKHLEIANARFHPTPLTSAFIDGCLEKGSCSTQGGAKYNFSGIQGVGVSTAGDSLAAVEKIVFTERKLSLVQIRDILSVPHPDTQWLERMRSAPKFGNDDQRADFWTAFVIKEYVRILKEAGPNTRGGPYLAGIYSNTAHVHFGRHTGALPCGRAAGAPFPSGMGPQNGMDRKGPTALINSMNRIDFSQIANGINFNLKLNAATLEGEKGAALLESLLGVYFNRGGMQVQLNVLDPEILRTAKEHPEEYPYLLVRVSGYAAYFRDLSPDLQNEVISRTYNSIR